MYLAQELVDNKAPRQANEEARCRAAISRAYYSVYCHLKDYLVNKQKIRITRQSQESDHQALIRTFKTITRGRDKKYGDYLDTLRIIRNQADYDDDYKLTSPSISNEALAAIDICNQIFGKFA
jgi:uncharacterized protein (UPF0332 family)